MPGETIVLVHGLWVNGLEMGLLRRRMQSAGYQTTQFSYPSRSNSPFENAMDLNKFAEKLDTETVHFLGHSLGGIIIRHLFYHFPQQRPGRIVTLGAPHNGSLSARRLARTLPGRWLLGRSVQQGLLGPLPPWPGTHELGSIAGTSRIGLGLLVRDLPQSSDGTVAVAETRLAGMTDHVEIPISHTAMLCSRAVIRQIQQFLQTGRFLHP